MDIYILGIFATFVLLLMLIGFLKQQIVLTIFSGIGFMLLGLFFIQGISYSTGATFTDVTWKVTDMVNTQGVWHSAYAIPIGLFLALFGLSLIIISGLEFWSGRKIKASDYTEGGDYEAEE